MPPRVPCIPLLISVVGHRDLVPAEVPAIRAAVDGLLRAIRERQPDVPIKLLTSQAEGADLLVAEVAKGLGISIVALLPDTEAQCRADLTTDAARAAFDRTMAGAEKLELAPFKGATGENSAASDLARDWQFERAGDLIALHSSLMIVIWDGLATEHRAGTAQTVKRRRAATDNDLTYEIRCSRLGHASQAHVDASASVIGFVAGATNHGGIERGIPPALVTLLDRTAEFNRDARRYAGRIQAQGRPLADVATSPVSDALQYLDQLFVTADWLAVHFRRCFMRALAARFSLWALVAYLLLAFKKTPDGIFGLLSIAGVLSAFAVGGLLAVWARRRSWDRRGLDYRALAEGLRVDYYWELAGVRARFDDAFAHEGFLHRYAQLEWMRAAMRTVNLRCALYARTATPRGFEQALTAWVGDPEAATGPGQLHYYRHRIRTLTRRLEVSESVSRAMMAGGLVLAIVLAADVALRFFDYSFVLAPAPRGLMLTSLALLTAYTAIFEVYLAEKADRSLVRQYLHMDSLFGSAARELRGARTDSGRLGILRELGHACLAEHAQWILSHRDKRIDGLRW